MCTELKDEREDDGTNAAAKKVHYVRCAIPDLRQTLSHTLYLHAFQSDISDIEYM